ncbi:Uncharacterized protein PHSC3_000157 [Chlamydiales bacterium STE3]|nr:Uncharacterized protein PHSC3_000157 [Chlamydiales bacterium STE3]
MLGFLRKHQKYFFVLITIVIVTSFSFFGTYGTLGGNSIHEQVAFTTIKGTQVTRGELEQFAQFISTDQEDSKLYGGALGPNFLNDGVIRKDLLETGLAAILLDGYSSDFKNDLQAKHVREANFKPYAHPDASFVSSATVWTYFAPEMVKNLEFIQKTTDPTSKEAIQAKIALYLSEKRLPAPYLKQILYHQEKQYSWIPHDENLDYQDLSLFGYHSLDDWFGPKFSKLIAQFIINSAEIAEQKGYRVTYEEALADLVRNAHVSFKENQNSSRLSATNPNDYMQQQLLGMRLDRTKAVQLWQKVLLFRRLFQDIGNSTLVDRSIYDTFNQFANETATGDLYQLPEEFRFNEYQSLPLFEIYLNAIAKRSKEEQLALSLPSTFLTPEEVAKKTPELVHKRYLVELTKIAKRNLQAKVSLREMLSYEIADTNWKTLQKQFPELGIKEAGTAEERLNALDSLDTITRSRVDNFARSAIVDAHPEWIDAALEATPARREVLSVRLKGESPAISGLKKGDELMALLDAAPLNEQQESLARLSFDKENYYKVLVIDRSENLEVLPYREARMTGVLDKLLDQKLEPFYVQVRNDAPEKFQNSDMSWKSFEEAKPLLAEIYLEPVTTAIKKDFAKRSQSKNQEMTKDRTASLRFYSILEQAKKAIEKDSQLETKWVRQERLENLESNKLSQALPLDEQWKLEKKETQLKRKQQSPLMHHQELFALPKASFSRIFDSPNGDAYFFHVTEKKVEDNPKAFEEQIARARFLLGSEAEQMFLYDLLSLIKAKQAISFNDANSDSATIVPEENDES